MDVRVKFFGGAKTVTGSKYLLEIDDFTLLVDCGMFQGLKELRLRNWDDFPVDPKSIDAVVLTHGHIDHSGYLPKLFQQGFTGPVYCTTATEDLLRILLLDSAKLQEEEANWARKKGYSKHNNPQPLYTVRDAQLVFPNVRGYEYHTPISISEKISLKFHIAGHILGASIVEILLFGDNQQKSIVFSGDLGNQQDPIMFPPDKLKNADILFIESTYGSRSVDYTHQTERLAEIINETFQRKGIVLIPAFSIGRTQNMLMYLKDALDKNLIPNCQVFMDSPMAISATKEYVKHHLYHKISIEEIESNNSFLNLRNNLIMVQTPEASNYLNQVQDNAIIISASGMMSGGRVLHHLFHRLPGRNNTLVIVGYQAEGTRGRKIIEGAKSVKIFGEMIPINCHIEEIEGLSAHADRDELLDWADGFESHPKMTFVVHGEEEGAEALAKTLRAKKEWNVFVPEYLESFQLFSGI